MIDPTGLGHGLGLKENDWFLQDSSGQQLATYDTVLGRARSEVRPLNLYVMRRKESPAQPPPRLAATQQADTSTNGEANAASALDAAISQEVDSILNAGDLAGARSSTVSVANASSAAKKLEGNKPSLKLTNVNSSRSKPAKGTAASSNESRKKTSSKKTGVATSRPEQSNDEDQKEKVNIVLPNGDELVPFCKLCNDPKFKSRKRAIHHALCPENEYFSNSKADKILKNIVEGVKLGCHACVKAYEQGRSPGNADTHSVLCPCRGESVIADNSRKLNRQTSNASSSHTKKDKPAASKDKTSKKAKGSSKKRPRDDQEEPAPKRKVTSKRDGASGRFVRKAEATTVAKSTSISSATKSSKANATRDKSKKSSQPENPSEGPRNALQSHQIQQSQPAPQQPPHSEIEAPCAPTMYPPTKRKSSDVESQRSTLEGSQKSGFQKVGQNALQQSAFRLSATHPPLVTPLVTNAAANAKSVTPVSPDDGAPCKTKWIRCENLWGPEGHVPGDVIVLTPSLGLGHYETVLDFSERYEVTPFSESTKYYKTHSTPEEGYHNIRLQRDSMAMRSWGLTLKRHEFGGACLVESVDPTSPAAAAVSYHCSLLLSFLVRRLFVVILTVYSFLCCFFFLSACSVKVFLGSTPGSGPAAALRINDMIVGFNGKEVGGMTVEGLHLELETAGPNLSLTISRYKYANQVANRIARAEEKVIAAIDDALNDDCHLGWVDENVTGASDTSLSVIASKALDSQLQSEVPLIRHNPADNAAPELQKDPSSDEPTATSLDTRTAAKNGVNSDTSEASTATQSSFMTPKQSSSQKLVRFQPDPESNEVSAAKVGLVAADSQPETPKATVECSEGQPQVKPPESPSRANDDGPVITDSQPETSQEMEHDSSEGQQKDNSQESCLADISVEEGYESGCEREPEQRDVNSEDDNEGGDDDEEEDDDGNAACGCVCGTIHGGQFVVFWIQCDSCNAWYNVARKCVGFSEEEAVQQGKWCCWACSPPEDDSENEEATVRAGGGKTQPSDDDDDDDDGYHSESSLETKFVRKKKRQRTSEDPRPTNTDPNQVFEKGTVVDVDREGSHLYGGMGHVVDSYVDEDGDRCYTVKYIVEGYTEGNIPANYVVVKNW